MYTCISTRTSILNMNMHIYIHFYMYFLCCVYVSMGGCMHICIYNIYRYTNTDTCGHAYSCTCIRIRIWYLRFVSWMSQRGNTFPFSTAAPGMPQPAVCLSDWLATIHLASTHPREYRPCHFAE